MRREEFQVGDLVKFRSSFWSKSAPATGVVLKFNPETSFGDTCIVFWSNHQESTEYVKMLEKLDKQS